MFDQQVTFLYTADPDASRRFYEETLELTCVLTQQGGCRIYRTGPASFVGLCAARDGRAANPNGVILCLVTQDVEGWGARLKAKGVVLEKEPQPNPDFAITHLFLRDPDGYLIEIQRFEDVAWPPS
ncbi:MAG: VOC family protein [Marivibrio sp.]|uniref:VOC family protein n=1 Tax=Marivibrio sp. TaxID=2039719 RepID=UPI0032EA93E7